MTLKVHVIEAASDPVAAPAFVGQHWINTSNGKQWLANGTASVSDWGRVLSDAVLDEQIRDVIGAAVQDSSSIDFTNNDAGDTMSLAVIPGGVDHDALLNYVVNEHIDHSTIAVNAGAGLTGGGDLTATRTIAMPNVGIAGTYKSVTTDAFGRVVAGSNPTTLAGYGITDAQPLDGDLTAIASLTGTGLIARTAINTATTRTITAGTYIGVTNGDGVSGNPVVAHSNSAVTPATYGSATQVPQIAVGATGHVDSASNVAIAIPSSQVTDFTEAAQDSVAAALTNSSTVGFTYNDAGNTISAAVVPGGVDHNSLANLASGDVHTQYALLAGRSGGQTLNGGTASGNNLVLSSTTNATKGKIFLGSSTNTVLDEVNNRLGIGQSSPTYKIDVRGTTDAVITTQTTSTISASFLEAKNDTSNYIEAGIYGSASTATLFGDSNTGKSFIISSANGPMGIGQVGAQPLILGTNNAERVKIDGTSGEVTIGGIAGAALTNNKLSVNSNVNSYAQSNVQNLSNGATASGDLVVTADNGTDTTNYVDLGVNSSGWSDPTFTINGPNDAYLYTNGGDLAIGSATANKVVFFTGGTLAANEIARFTPTGQLAIGTGTPNAAAKLQLDSTTQGFLMPRMTTTQMNAISSPPQGLQIFNTTLNAICTFDGAQWLFEIWQVVQNNQTSTSTTYADITELVTPSLPVGRYVWQYVGSCQSTLTTTGVGIRLGVAGTGGATFGACVGNWTISQGADGTAKNFDYSQLSATTNVTSASAVAANTDFPVIGHGVFSISGAGAVAAQIRSETSLIGVSVRINSSLNIRRITG